MKIRFGKSLKKTMPSSLMGRSLLILVVPVVLIQLVSGYVFYNRHWDHMIDRLCATVANEASMMVREVDLINEVDVIQTRLQHMGEALGFKASYTQGTPIAEPIQIMAKLGWEKLVADVLAPKLTRQLGYNYTLRFDFQNKWVYLDVRMPNGLLSLEFPERRVFSSSGYIYLLWVFASSLVLLLTAILFMRNQVRPIRKLAIAADRLGKGQELTFFKPEGAREVRQAGQSFLDMSKRIKKQLEQRGLMLAGISHDLRTPITRLRLALSMTPNDDDIKAMQDDLNEMEQMIHGYLDFVRDQGSEGEESVLIGDFVRDLVSTQKLLDQNIALNIIDNPLMAVRPLGLNRAITNILSNAHKYADHAYVTIKQTDEHHVLILIEDDGAGVPQEQFEDVFKPFYRADTSRTAGQGSVGLGLSIAMDVVHSHGGAIWLDKSQQHGGLAVHIQLPV